MNVSAGTNGWAILATVGVLFLAAEPVTAQVTVTYSYDAAGRLENATYVNEFAIDYTYDASGNLTQYERMTGGGLPVELAGFEAEVVDLEVHLSWTTASEEANAGFEIEAQSAERKTQSWEVLAFVEGSGTTQELKMYTYRTTHLEPGTWNFRLKQVDFDGGFEYSPEIEVLVEVPGTHILTDVYPNPVASAAEFSLAVADEQHVEVELFDALGRSIGRVFDDFLSADRTQKIQIAAAQLPAGLYIIRAEGETFADTKRMVVIR